MLNDPVRTLTRTLLPELGFVRVRGADAVRFLQGQLSNDIALLSADRSLLAGLHNPQGRVIALLRLAFVAADDVLAILPRELAGPVAARLAKFVLRAKAKVTDASSEWKLCGVMAAGDADERPSASVTAARRDEDAAPGTIVVRMGREVDRWLEARLIASAAGASTGTPSTAHVGAPAAASASTPPTARAGADAESGALAADSVAGNRQRWALFDIAAGMPQVYAATSEQFVAQMLNLDVVDAISFTKGCYTGQEVVARAHYRGRVKRRMQRFRTLAVVRFAPNDTGTLRDGRTFRVVDAVQLDDGRSEFLAVTQTAAGEPDAGGDAPPPAPTETAAQTLDVETLALPYELP